MTLNGDIKVRGWMAVIFVTLMLTVIGWTIKSAVNTADQGARLIAIEAKIEKLEVYRDISTASAASLVTANAMLSTKLDALKESIDEIKALLREYR